MYYVFIIHDHGCVCHHLSYPQLWSCGIFKDKFEFDTRVSASCMYEFDNCLVLIFYDDTDRIIPC